MKKENKEELTETYIKYINKTPECPACGGVMHHVDGMLDWQCSECGSEGSMEYNIVNEESYIKLAREYTYEEIYEDPIKNMPECCRSCDGAYPHCLVSCNIFDD